MKEITVFLRTENGEVPIGEVFPAMIYLLNIVGTGIARSLDANDPLHEALGEAWGRVIHTAVVAGPAVGRADLQRQLGCLFLAAAAGVESTAEMMQAEGLRVQCEGTIVSCSAATKGNA